MRRGGNRIRLVQFTRAFYLGGTEGQVIELVRNLPDRYQVRLAVIERAGPWVRRVEALGHHPPSFSLKGSVMKPNTLRQIFRLAAWFRKEKAELVHAHDFYATLLAVPAARLAGAKVVVGRLDLAHWHGDFRRAALAECTRRADHVIANANAIQRMLVSEEHIPKEKVTVIPNGIDLETFDAKVREGLREPVPEVEGPVLVHVANMSHPVKRQEDLLSALAILRGEGYFPATFLVGDGPRRPEVERFARRLGLEDQVHFLGHRTDVPAIYARASVGILCSAAEGTSNAVMEGMAASIPMVVTAVGGSPDLIADGERGWVVPPSSPRELAGAIREALDSPTRAKAMGARARAHVGRVLSIRNMVDRHDLLYRRMLEGP